MTLRRLDRVLAVGGEDRGNKNTIIGPAEEARDPISLCCAIIAPWARGRLLERHAIRHVPVFGRGPGLSG